MPTKNEVNYKIQKKPDRAVCENCRNFISLSPYKNRCIIVQDTNDYKDRVNSISLNGICDKYTKY